MEKKTSLRSHVKWHDLAVKVLYLNLSNPGSNAAEGKFISSFTLSARTCSPFWITLYFRYKKKRENPLHGEPERWGKVPTVVLCPTVCPIVCPKTVKRRVKCICT